MDDLWLTPPPVPAPPSLQRQRERVRINRSFCPFEDVRKLRLSCAPCWGRRSWGRRFSRHIRSDKSLRHVKGEEGGGGVGGSFQTLHNQLCLVEFLCIHLQVNRSCCSYLMYSGVSVAPPCSIHNKTQIPLINVLTLLKCMCLVYLLYSWILLYYYSNSGNGRSLWMQVAPPAGQIMKWQDSKAYS